MTSGHRAPDPQSFSPRSRAWTRFVAETAKNGTMTNCDGEHFSKKSIPYGSPRQGDQRKRTANGLSRFELFGKITTLTGNLHASLHFLEKIHSSNCSHFEPVIKDFPIRVNQDFSPRRRQNPGAGIRRGSGSRNTEGGREGEKTSSRLVPGAPRRGARNFQKRVLFWQALG